MNTLSFTKPNILDVKLDPDQPAVPKTYLTAREVCAMIGVHATTLWRWCKDGYFPQPYKLALRAVRWKTDEVEAWIESRQRRVSGGSDE